MPRYDYQCDNGHRTERQGGYDEDRIRCPTCDEPARRQAVYRSQGVIFKGSGFTRSVIVPDPPQPTSTAELTTDERMEVLDDYAKENYEYDENVLPYKKEEKRRSGMSHKKEERNANRSS